MKENPVSNFFEQVAIYAGWFGIGAFAFQYTLWNAFEKDVPWYADIIAGIIAPMWVMTSTMTWVATLCDAPTPFFV